MIEARPTIYKGIKMRSRLEAKWAGRMDAAKIPWEYEPNAFAWEDGQYLPDFRVGRSLYLEIKGAMPSSVPEVLKRMEIVLLSEPDASLLMVVDETQEAWYNPGFIMSGQDRPWLYFYDFFIDRLELVPKRSDSDLVGRVQKLDPNKAIRARTNDTTRGE